MRMRQSIAEFEHALVQEAAEDRERREEIVRQAQLRSQRRHIERQHKHGTLRFVALVLTLIATAVLVTWAMFETLYRVIG